MKRGREERREHIQMQQYKVIFSLVNGEKETAYFTENPISRVNDWLERNDCVWVRLEDMRLNLQHVVSIQVGKLAEANERPEEEEVVEWL
ncbi:hypothetical protein [Halalkalibacter oceani]|uniref:Uncharacterized protein n=1 Tax=Halalkalibacter oceani TaxID=1653776 RepID=A0A9X2DQ14_9BACI|nr:hypothetical protein [Halalkalibacter oceani]MCM3713277.1 hypothetical protein [Halalkalibacter oceani]